MNRLGARSETHPRSRLSAGARAVLGFGALASAAVMPVSGFAQEMTTETVRVGDPAPDFELEDVRGNSYRLSELVKRGPVVIEFFRSGGW